MKLQQYSVWPSSNTGPFKQAAIIGSFETHSQPLIFLQRPKHIKDDAVWAKIINSISLTLPKNFEVK